VSLDDLADQLGPLPQSGENARLQRESIKALNKLLVGQDILVLREEPKEDFGVDCSFELNLGGQMTNFRAQIQMKASAHLVITAKGYIPLQVSSSNLHHLLNGTSAIYFLWDAKADEFWYVWAQDENRRLSAENPVWQDQSSITLQFRERFTTVIIESIFRRIFAQGRVQREIQDRLAKATEGETVVFRIDSDSLKITDPNMATSLLLASGTAIVASGYPQEVLDLMRLIEPSMLDLPRMQLTYGYAEYMVGNHWKALAHIRQAMARGQELSVRDNSFLGNLKDSSELQVGLIDSKTYEQHMDDRARTLTGLEALEAEQDALYRRCVRETDLSELSELARKFRDTTERILSSPQAPRTIKLGAKLLLLYVEGVEANLEASQTESAAEFRSKLYPGDAQGILNRLQGARQLRLQWESQADEALKEAYELNHPILIFQALVISLRIRIGRLFEERLNTIVDEKKPSIVPTSQACIQRMLDEAAKLNAINGSLEGRLQLEELQADFLELRGDLEGAKTLARKTYPHAQAMGFGPIAEHSKRLLDDNSLLLQWARSYEVIRAEDKDFHKAKQTDEELKKIATQLLRSVESPPARLAVIEAHLHSFRQISNERIDWCRHLQILEDLGAAGDPRTAYSELLTRKCLCDKFDYMSEDASSDFVAVIADFKLTFCRPCPARDPKRK
jgi:hypothetical protein